MKISQLIIRASLPFLFGIFSINLVNAETISSPLFDYMDELDAYREGLELQGFPVLSQRDPSIYSNSNFMQVQDSVSNTSSASAPVEKLACLATVYVMLARESSDPSATIEDFYADPRKHNGNGPGALAPSTIGSEAPVDIKQIIQYLKRGEPVILHGKGGVLENHFVLVTGYRKNLLKRTQLIAHDPWPLSGNNMYGSKIYIKGSKRKIKHPELKDVTFTGMRTTGITTKSFLAYNTDKPPCTINSDRKIAYLGTCENGYANGDGYVFDRALMGSLAGAKGEVTYMDGFAQGYATVVFKDSSVFEGELKDNVYNGPGKFTSVDGVMYEGEFLNHQKHGPGILTLANGDTHEQVWEHGELVSGYNPEPEKQSFFTISARPKSIADEFFENSPEAIKKYSKWSEIQLIARSIGVRSGAVMIEDIQVPAEITRQAEKLNDDFSWDQWAKVTMGGNNVYEKNFRIICVVPMEGYAEMTVREGSLLKAQGKLSEFSNNTVVFDCK